MKLAMEAPPVEGSAVNVTVLDDFGAPMPGATVRVSYRTGLDGARELSLGVTDGLGRVRWPVDAPGKAEILVGDERMPVSAGHGSVPIQTYTILALLLAFSATTLILGITGRRLG